MPRSRHRVIIRWGIICLVVVATIGTLIIILTGSSDEQQVFTCDDWQSEYARVVEEGRGGVLASINLGPTANRLNELDEQRPDDCPDPEI